MKTYCIYLSNETLKLFSKRKGKAQLLTEARLKQLKAQELEHQFKEIFSHIPDKAICRILLDVQEEEILFTTLPHILPWEKKNTINLKLRQLIDASASAACITNILPSLDKNSKEKQLRIFNINKTDLINQLILTIEKKGLPVWGIYSSALLLEKAIYKQIPPTPHMLLLDTSDSFRIYVFINKHLYLYRVIEQTPDNPLSPPSLAQEINLTLRYFYNERIISYNTPFTFGFYWTDNTPLITPEQIKETLGLLSIHAPWITETENHLKVTAPLSTQIKCQHKTDWPNCLTNLTCKKPPSSYPFPQVTLTRISFFSRMTLIVLTISIIIGTLVWGSWLFAQNHAHQKLLQQTKQQINQLKKHYNKLNQKINLKYDLNQVIELSKKARQLQKELQMTQLLPILKHFGEIIQRYPELRLQNLSIAKAEIRQSSETSQQEENQQSKKDNSHSQLKQSLSLIPLNATMETEIQIIQPRSTYQENMQLIYKFINQLKNMPNVVNIIPVELPINTTWDKEQPVTPDMLLPETLEFKLNIQYHWENKRP